MKVIMVNFDETKQEKKIKELRTEGQESLTRMLSDKYQIPYIDLSAISINTDALGLVPEDVAHKTQVAGFQMTGKILQLAVVSPQRKDTLAVIDDLKNKGYKVNLFLASTRSLERAWGRYKEISHSTKTEAGILDIANEQILVYEETLHNIDDIAETLRTTLLGDKRHQTTRLLELFIAGALATDASDIHIEPKEDEVRLRLRLDGVLQDLISINHKVYKLLLSRIKLLSSLKLNVRDEAQDGRFSIKLNDTSIEIRTSIIPGNYGESIVMRILNPKSINVELKNLGIDKKLLGVLDHEIHKPNGLILNTGPTGSGKTTTLYAFLRKISTPQIKIITIEDPIEYHLPNVTQTQTNDDKGYTFLEGLRSSLRQDPDVIMVGEIRDAETAGTAINAALTGHLVLSTLHTNTAAGAIPRLIDLKVNPKVIGSSLNLVLAQRLVRRLCDTCKIKIEPTPEEREILEKVIASLPQEDKPSVSYIWKPQKCDECNNTGFKGRVGIYEAIVVDEVIEKLVVENPSEREIRRAALPQGLRDLRQDGVVKILDGITSFDELARIVDMEAEILDQEPVDDLTTKSKS